MPVTNDVGQPDLDRLLTMTEVAARLNVSRQTVRQLMDTGQLTFVQLTDTIKRFRPGDVEAFLNARLFGARA
jgi:excisionase family DNA binding protein